MPELVMSGPLISSFDIAALVKNTGVSVLQVRRGNLGRDAIGALKAAFSQPEEASLLTVLKVQITHQSIDTVSQLLQSEPKRLETLVILNSKTLDTELFLRVLQLSGALRCVRIDGKYEAKFRGEDLQRLASIITQHSALSIDFGAGGGAPSAGAAVPPVVTDPKSAPKDTLIFVIGHKRFVPCNIAAARNYSLLVGGLLESGDVPQTVAEREIPLELDNPVSTQGAITAVLFLEKCATTADHKSALENEGQGLPPYLPAHQLAFANKYIFPLGAPKAVHLLSEMLEVATYLNVPTLKRYVRSLIMLLLAKGDLDAILLRSV